MKIIESYCTLINPPSYTDMLHTVEYAARKCYKSEDKMVEGNHSLVTRCIDSKHTSVIEHSSVSAEIVCDRGVTHELVRHRLCSFSQESTRYANYSKDKFGNEITVVKPSFWSEDDDNYKRWVDAMCQAEQTYMEMIANGATAQEARSVLPNSTKTEIIVTANLREWRHIFSLRTHSASHPDMVKIMTELKSQFVELYPIFFEDMR